MIGKKLFDVHSMALLRKVVTHNSDASQVFVQHLKITYTPSLYKLELSLYIFKTKPEFRLMPEKLTSLNTKTTQQIWSILLKICKKYATGVCFFECYLILRF